MSHALFDKGAVLQGSFWLCSQHNTLLLVATVKTSQVSESLLVLSLPALSGFVFLNEL